jgi:hypothetical protein
MQTFMPHAVFTTSAEVLDNRRLGKQRIEAMQLYKILTGQTKSKSWKNHPACKMWSGYENALASYYNCIRQQWIKRGFKNTMPELPVSEEIINIPPWIGNEKFHASHRANLKRKDPIFYGKYGWKESPELPYVWPTKDGLM